MRFTRCDLPDDRLRIMDEDNNFIILKCFGNDARIMSVPSNYELIKAAEVQALSMGMEKVVFDYSSELEEMSSYLQEAGYNLTDSYKILSVDARELMISKGVTKSLSIDFPGIEYVPFRDLILYQAQELVDMLEREKIILGRNDIDRFDEDLSCIAYDEDSKPKAVVLVSTQGKEILVELLYGMGGHNPQFIMAALQGFAREINYLGLLYVYDTISMLEVNESITPLVKRLLDKEYSLEVSGTVKKAVKELSDKGEDSGIEIEEITGRHYMEEKIGYPYQNNINFKSQWKYTND